MSPRTRTRRTGRILGGMAVMAAIVAGALLVFANVAGNLGIPYFGFTDEHGSRCRNELVGHSCDSVTLAGVAAVMRISLPPGTQVQSAHYRRTHDYFLTATLTVPQADAAAVSKTLTATFGGCQPDRPIPLPSAGLTSLCVRTDDARPAQSLPNDQQYSIGSGLRDDGSMVLRVDLRSR